jgi:arylformamidase
MPYILSPEISDDLPALWQEGAPYQRGKIYSISDGKMPPVNYDWHTFRPHSLTHAEGGRHTADGKMVIEDYFSNPNYFFGSAVVVRLPGNNYRALPKLNGVYHWEVTKNELQEAVTSTVKSGRPLQKLILTTEFYPQNGVGFHDPNYVLTLSQEAADYLISHEQFNLYGTSWKSTDYQPGRLERPIHNTIFKKAIIFECLDMRKVPAGEYFFVGFPLRIKGASESPVTPVLFEYDEISNSR